MIGQTQWGQINAPSLSFGRVARSAKEFHDKDQVGEKCSNMV